MTSMPEQIKPKSTTCSDLNAKDLDAPFELETLPRHTEDGGAIQEATNAYKRGFAFWMVFAGNLMVDLPSALDLTAVSTALPTITEHLEGTDFIWASSAYAIAATAVLPTVGGLVSVFGRKPVILCFILLFALGSALCGAAQSMAMFIGGRLVQGLGGGGCIAVTEIIYADLIPLPERGKFYAITASVWALASAVGPPIGGAFSSSGAWRWLFFLNLPLCGVAFVLVAVFLRVHTPRDSFRNKMARMDWLGLGIVISSTVSVMMALTWAGVRYPWVSAHVLVPLCLGAIGLVLFFVMELCTNFIKEPTIPPFILMNRTTLSGYLGTFFHGIAAMALIYYLPVYFQASKLASPVRSGIYMFGVAFTIPPFAIIMGVSAQVLNRYRPQNYLGWMITIAGFGLLSTLNEDSSITTIVGYQIFLGIGVGIIWIGTQFPILAPLPFSNNAHALAFFTFTRVFAQSWGTVIGGTILQNTLQRHLPSDFVASLPSGTQLAYVIIPRVAQLAEPLQTEVRAAFAKSTATIWHVMIAVSGVGLFTCLLMGEVPMRKSMDEKWGLEPGSEEKGSPDNVTA